MSIRLIFLFLFIPILSCRNPESEKAELMDTLMTKIDSIRNLVENTKINDDQKPINDIRLPLKDTSGKTANSETLEKSKIDITVFRNSDISGYGYDILIDGRVYVHQQNIPALPGNNGFVTEEKARRVAELVKYKIRNGVMPPTIEVQELDSLGVKSMRDFPHSSS